MPISLVSLRCPTSDYLVKLILWYRDRVNKKNIFAGMVSVYSIKEVSGGARISQRGRQPQRGVSTYYLVKENAENCITMKEFQPRGGVH